MDIIFFVCLDNENTLVAVVSNLYELSIKKLFVNIVIEIKAINIINVLVPYLPLLPLNIKVVDFGDIKIPRSDNVAPAIMTDSAKSLISTIKK